MEEVDKNAKIVWDYMLMHHKLEKADVIIALGSNDIRVADRAFELQKEKFADLIICSGGIAHTNDLLNTGWEKGEAEMFKDRLIELGLVESNILAEDKAKNTGDNAVFVKNLVKEKNIICDTAIVVTKPFMERRVYATFKKRWPELNIVISSPQFSYEDYIKNSVGVSKENIINIMVGDFIRIKEYPKLGFQIEQEIPEEVWQAGQELIKMGYNKHLIK
jgi:uncharacterized SAM-binding protein YcdF (DUF218 family)